MQLACNNVSNISSTKQTTIKYTFTMNTYVFTAFMLAFVVSVISGQQQFYGRNESSCLQKGGICILGTECEKLVEGQNLCPEQKAQGFECCHGVPKSEHRCRQLGGECFKTNYCSQKLIAPKATDCKAGEECCILV